MPAYDDVYSGFFDLSLFAYPWCGLENVFRDVAHSAMYNPYFPASYFELQELG